MKTTSKQSWAIRLASAGWLSARLFRIVADEYSKQAGAVDLTITSHGRFGLVTVLGLSVRTHSKQIQSMDSAITKPLIRLTVVLLVSLFSL
jgi:uncharacterized protein (UPF0303 family)